MATAISLVSQSSDRYLQLFTDGESVEQMIDSLKEFFNEELGYLEICQCASTDYDPQVVMESIDEVISSTKEL